MNHQKRVTLSTGRVLKMAHLIRVSKTTTQKFYHDVPYIGLQL